MEKDNILNDRPIQRVGWDSEEGYCHVEVGSKGVSKIDTYEQFLGDHSIVWIQIWQGDDIAIRYNARNVDSIHYNEEEY